MDKMYQSYMKQNKLILTSGLMQELSLNMVKIEKVIGTLKGSWTKLRWL